MRFYTQQSRALGMESTYILKICMSVSSIKEEIFSFTKIFPPLHSHYIELSTLSSRYSSGCRMYVHLVLDR